MSQDVITVYWRPGRGFCASLLRGLAHAGLAFDRINIWEDEDAAAFVRRVTRGNETVPTVRVGQVALVNPSSHEVLAVVALERPDDLPAGYEPSKPGLLSRLLRRLLGG